MQARVCLLEVCSASKRSFGIAEALAAAMCVRKRSAGGEDVHHHDTHAVSLHLPLLGVCWLPSTTCCWSCNMLLPVLLLLALWRVECEGLHKQCSVDILCKHVQTHPRPSRLCYGIQYTQKSLHTSLMSSMEVGRMVPAPWTSVKHTNTLNVNQRW